MSQTAPARDGCPTVGVVIVNWQRPDDVMACLRTLAGQDYPALEVVVVDNGSPRGNLRVIREHFQDVFFIENHRNLGFTGGSNAGIRFLLGRGADYVLLLNDDAEVASDAIMRLIDVAESEPQIGILGPTIYYYDRANVIWSAGGAVDRYGRSRHLRLDQVDDGGDETALDVDYVTGCALLAKRSLIEQVGLLDDRFFAYFEENEWCARARQSGFRVVHVPTARAWHKISAADRDSRLYLYLMARNRLLFLTCTGANPVVIAWAAAELLRTAMSWLLKPEHRARRTQAGALIRGVAHFAVRRFGAPPPPLFFGA